VRGLSIVGLFYERQQRFFEDVVVLRTAQERLLAELLYRKAASRTRAFLIGIAVEIAFVRLSGQETAEQFVERDLALDRYALLDRAVLTEVHLAAHPVVYLGQVNSRIVLLTKLTLHCYLSSQVLYHKSLCQYRPIYELAPALAVNSVISRVPAPILSLSRR
jgi:hypothetical protein